MNFREPTTQRSRSFTKTRKRPVLGTSGLVALDSSGAAEDAKGAEETCKELLRGFRYMNFSRSYNAAQPFLHPKRANGPFWGLSGLVALDSSGDAEDAKGAEENLQRIITRISVYEFFEILQRSGAVPSSPQLTKAPPSGFGMACREGRSFGSGWHVEEDTFLHPRTVSCS